jgi:succinate dehydrogenase / fumarate reductase iron-sulfur subunit
MAIQEKISARIFRYDPTVDAEPRYDTFNVPYERDMRVLDVLDYVSENCGVGIGYRWFCGVKRCGMCGVTVNGKPVLACWEKATPSMVITPLANMPVIRDLVVDRSALEQRTLDLEPLLQRQEPYRAFPEPLTHQDFKDAFPLMTCIECYVCTAACPVLSDAGEFSFAGPASLVQLAKVALHPKDEGDRAALALKANIYACVSCYGCSNVCPVGINVLEDAIEKLKRQCAVAPIPHSEARHLKAFNSVVRQYGRIHPPTLMRRTVGLLASVRNAFLALKLYRKNKAQVVPKTVSRVDEVRKLFDVVERKK